MMIECIISNYMNSGISYFPFLPSFWYNWKQEDIHKRNTVSVSHPMQPHFCRFSLKVQKQQMEVILQSYTESKLATASDFPERLFYVCREPSETSRFKYH